MRLTLAVSNQFGPTGPQAGTELEAIFYGYGDDVDDNELMFFCKAVGHPGYYWVYESQIAENVNERREVVSGAQQQDS